MSNGFRKHQTKAEEIETYIKENSPRIKKLKAEDQQKNTLLKGRSQSNDEFKKSSPGSELYNQRIYGYLNSSMTKANFIINKTSRYEALEYDPSRAWKRPERGELLSRSSSFSSSADSRSHALPIPYEFSMHNIFENRNPIPTFVIEPSQGSGPRDSFEVNANRSNWKKASYGGIEFTKGTENASKNRVYDLTVKLEGAEVDEKEEEKSPELNTNSQSQFKSDGMVSAFAAMLPQLRQIQEQKNNEALQALLKLDPEKDDDMKTLGNLLINDGYKNDQNSNSDTRIEVAYFHLAQYVSKITKKPVILFQDENQENGHVGDIYENGKSKELKYNETNGDWSKKFNDVTSLIKNSKQTFSDAIIISHRGENKNSEYIYYHAELNAG